MLQIEIAITFLFLDSLSLNFTVSGDWYRSIAHSRFLRECA